jgi:hypothetical protein
MKRAIQISLVLLTLIASQARALDLDQEIHQQDTDAAQIMNTLGHSVNQATSKDTDQKVTVALIHHKKPAGAVRAN